MAEALEDLQKQFAAHIRDPRNVPAPDDVEDRRMAIYRDLFFRNLSNFIAKSFPVLRRLYGPGEWSAMMRDFYINHRCKTPLFPEIPREFLQYLQEQRADHADDPPFMFELAHYEWVELALDLDTQELDDLNADPAGDLMDGIPVLSPLAWPLVYRYPVHQIRKDFQPSEAPQEPTHLLVYRNRQDEVKFIQLNAVSALLINLMKEDGTKSGLELLQAVAAALGHADPAKIISAGQSLLQDLQQRDVILGTLKT